ncbi:proteasome Inhibitor PI31 superfamily domain-containing protein [Histoplasma capsulatum]|uniref:Proteasome Inhibitor PI31 superfamily domain-containing protein n=1 Tax=Ajellomyces capsulatus TaxID=5037 RepID=A0A8A1MAQ1_AJECA|nr:predicted protein [Histoplasma mississippiense (nom. inval.)]EDN08471.1 predicted protein [Histoplasma mississippiense (nom. inval.)]QSS63029.1 proteasome Inhibitor PI31 superfamily domain-containing protein [Histoplasma capsulatum]
MDASSTTSGAERALSSRSILSRAAASIGNDADVLLKDPWEAIALIGHACMAAVSFRLIGLDESHRIESQEPSSPLPKEWNANSTYAFTYSHPQSSMQFLLKISRLGDNAVIYALALGHDKTTSFDIQVKDYVSESSLPLTKSTEELTQLLEQVFISLSRLSDFITLFKINVIQKLAPGLQKESYEDDSSLSRERQQGEGYVHELGPPLRQPRQPTSDPLSAPPRRSPVPAGDFPPPGFEDEYEINVPPRGFHPQGTSHEPRRPNIGERDLYPPGFGPHDPLIPHFGPQGGGGGGGMHPTFDDPMFQRVGSRGGGDEYDPQVPPGARYDPVGPGDGPPMGRGRGHHGFPGARGGFGGGFGGPFGGDII